MSILKALPPGDPGDVQPDQPALPHILLVLDQFPRALGGGERIALKLAALLPRYGYRASILTFSIHPESQVYQVPSPCPIYLLPLRRTYDLTAFRAARELSRFIKQQNVKIVHTFFESSDLWAGVVTKAASEAKLVWSRRDMGILRERKHRIAYRLMSGVPDAVIAVSEQVRRHCIDVDGIDPSRVCTIYNGIDLDSERPPRTRAQHSEKILIATVGNIRRVKGHDLFIRAAASIVPRFPAASFAIAGDVLEKDYFAELQALVDELGLTGSFHFVGAIRDPHEYLSSADIFVLPSRSEGFSNAIVEAMAASLPAVVTAVGGNAEAVENGANGFVVAPEDPDALAAAIVRLLSDLPLARKMGETGRQMAEQKFSMHLMMKQTTAAYESLL